LLEKKVELLSNRPKFETWVSLLAVAGFSIFIVYLFLFTDLIRVAIVIGQVNIPIYLIAFLCIIAEMVFNALEWKATLDNVAVQTSLKRVWNLSWVGFFLDALIPGGLSGDIFIIYLLSRDRGVDGVKVAASMVIKDILELLVVFASLIIGIVLLILNYAIGGVLLFAIGVTMVFLSLPLILVVYLSTNVSVTKRLLKFLVRAVAKVRRRKPNDKFGNKLEEQITDFHDVIMIMKNKPRTMVKPMFYQIMAWVFDILVLFFVFVALGTTVGADKILITNSIVNNVRGQGVALAGISQIVSSQLYGILGINLSLAQASSLLSGFANFWFRLIISFVFFEFYGLGTVAEKLLAKALEVRKKEARKVFNEQTQSDKNDFQDKRESDKKDYDDKRDSDKRAFNDKRASDKRDYEKNFQDKKESEKKNYTDKRDSDKKTFNNGRASDKRDYEDKRESDKEKFKERESSMK